MAKFFIFSVLSNVSMLLHSALCGKPAGQDTLGNRYYRGKPRQKGGRDLQE
jgi:NADH:ubiquinone oxidoreductase subunit